LVSSDGSVAEVLWGSASFRAGITSGTQVLGVNGRSFSSDELKRAIRCAAEGDPIDLVVQSAKRHREVRIECPTGHRYPALEAIRAERRLDAILAPREE
jgi:predicted metalloprotease with PDZ domain